MDESCSLPTIHNISVTFGLWLFKNVTFLVGFLQSDSSLPSLSPFFFATVALGRSRQLKRRSLWGQGMRESEVHVWLPRNIGGWGYYIYIDSIFCWSWSLPKANVSGMRNGRKLGTKWKTLPENSEASNYFLSWTCTTRDDNSKSLAQNLWGW